ncbi:MAG: DUF2892 domain-containing protein [Bacteroidota bacterium]
MKRNMGTADRTVRIIAALLLAYLVLSGTVSGVVALLLGIVGAAFLITSALSHCPVYTPLKISTIRKRQGTP